MHGNNKNSKDVFPKKLLPLLLLNTHIVIFIQLFLQKQNYSYTSTEVFCIFFL